MGPGNVLLLLDGRLGLIDYGQVKTWNDRERLTYAKLIVALYEDNRPEVVRVMTEEMGLKTKHMDSDVIYRMAAFWNDRDTEDVTNGQNIQLFMEELERLDPVIEISDAYVMAGRVSFLLRGMANAFNLQMRTAEHWYPFAKQVISEIGDRVEGNETEN